MADIVKVHYRVSIRRIEARIAWPNPKGRCFEHLYPRRLKIIEDSPDVLHGRVGFLGYPRRLRDVDPSEMIRKLDAGGL